MKTTQSLRAGTVALALAASAVTVPTAFAADTDAEGIPAVASGTINWPIKESLNKYIVGRIAQGEITTTDGVTADENNSFDFAVNSDESELDADGNGTLQLDGSIHYYGHAGELDLKYSDVKINIENGTEATITADYHLIGGFPGEEPRNEEVEDAEIASFDLEEALIPEANETLNRADLQTTFLQGAADSLLFYQAGPVDDGDIDLSVTFGEAPAETPGEDENEAPGEDENPADDGKDNPADDDEDQDDEDKQEDPKKDGSSKGGIIAIIVAILAAIGAAVGEFIPGLNLKNFGF